MARLNGTEKKRERALTPQSLDWETTENSDFAVHVRVPLGSF